MKWIGNDIGDEGAMKISESLMINTTLATLNLGGDDNTIKNIKNNIYRNEMKMKKYKRNEIQNVKEWNEQGTILEMKEQWR